MSCDISYYSIILAWHKRKDTVCRATNLHDFPMVDDLDMPLEIAISEFFFSQSVMKHLFLQFEKKKNKKKLSYLFIHSHTPVRLV